MPTTTTFPITRIALPFFACVAIAITGCNGAAIDSALTEVKAPASTQIHQPISNEEAEQLRKSHDTPTKTESGGHFCPACLAPDLTVVEDDRPQWHCIPGFCYWADARGFDIENIGTGDAPAFHVAVIQGTDGTYGFDVPGLAAGHSEYFQITEPSWLGPKCGVNALVLLNPFDVIFETNYSNNAVTVAGICDL
jgi:hypothetical protein